MPWDDFAANANGFSIFTAAMEDSIVDAIQRVAAEHSWTVSLLPPPDGSDGSFELSSVDSGSLRLNLMVWREPGDRLSHTILGATNWVRGAQGTPDDRATVTAALDGTNVLIGAVVEERIVSCHDPRFEALVALASRVDGLLFNGFAFADASGAVLVHA